MGGCGPSWGGFSGDPTPLACDYIIALVHFLMLTLPFLKMTSESDRYSDCLTGFGFRLLRLTGLPVAVSSDVVLLIELLLMRPATLA